MQLFAVVCAAAEPRIGFPYAVALSYVVVWAVARSMLLSHGARCRLDTCLCFALVTFALAKTKAELRDTDANQSIAGVLASGLLVAALPSGCLWWPPKQGSQERLFQDLEAFVRSNVPLLARRHVERPPQGEGFLKCLFNTLRTKPAEQKRFYESLQRLDTRPRGLGVGEQSRVDAIWSLVEDAVAPPPAGAAASSSECPGAADAAPPPAAEAQAEQQVGSVPLWAGPSDAWADFASDRAQLQELVAWIRDNDGVDPGADCSPFRPAWSRARARCSRATGPSPRDRLLPEGVRSLIPLIDKISEEWSLYAEKQNKRKGKQHGGWDERFLAGEWDVTDVTSQKMHDLNRSSPCLSGGRALASLAGARFRAAQQLPRGKIANGSCERSAGALGEDIACWVARNYPGSIARACPTAFVFSTAPVRKHRKGSSTSWIASR